MNNHQENEALLREVLGESSFASRREALLENTLSQVRRRRRLRQLRRGACALGLALVAVVLLLNLRRHSSVETRLAPPKPYLLVETQPLSPSVLVDSKSVSPVSFVPTVPTSEIVTTAAGRIHPEVVNDEALLAMAAPNPAVLVRRGNGQAELVFVNSDEESPE